MNDCSLDREDCYSRLEIQREMNDFLENENRIQNESSLKIKRGDYSDLGWDVAEDRGMTLEKICELHDRYYLSDLELLANRSIEEGNGQHEFIEWLNLFEKNI